MREKLTRKNVAIAGGILLALATIAVCAFSVFAIGGSRSQFSMPTVGMAGEAAFSRAEAPAMAMDEEAAVAADGAYFSPMEQAQVTERMIIRTGAIEMTVADMEQAKTTIEGMIAEMAGQGAFIISSNEQNNISGDRGIARINMSIRVPAERFDDTMDRLAELAVRVTDRNESGEDVTEEFFDLETRLESLEAARDRLLEIMVEANTTEDLLRAEEQLTRRETEIESIKGRLQFLSQSVALSSIHITLRPDQAAPAILDRWRPTETADQSFAFLMRSLRFLGDLVIFVLIVILPWLLILALVFFAVRAIIRRRRRNRTSTG